MVISYLVGAQANTSFLVMLLGAIWLFSIVTLLLCIIGHRINAYWRTSRR